MKPVLLSWGQWTPAPAESVSGNLIQEGGTQFSKDPPSEMRHGGEQASEQAGAEAKITRPHGASWELSVEGRPGLWLFCPPDYPQGHVHHPEHLDVPLTWGFPPAPRVSLPEDATALNRAQNAWLRPGAQNSTFSGTARDPGACWRRGGCDGSKWGWEGAEPYRGEPSEAGSGPGAIRKIRSLLPWTAVWEDFLGLASLRDHWVAVMGFLFCFGGHLKMQSYWYFLSLELQHQLQNNLWNHL